VNDVANVFLFNPAADHSKGPQQRLVIRHFRDGYTSSRVTQEGPPVTIHKHSKAVAFSISRHYKPPTKVHPSQDPNSGGVHRSNRGTGQAEGAIISSSSIVASPTRRSSNMILLAPRRVQEAYTSTNTTRKLRTHNLLDDKGSGKPHDKSSGKPHDKSKRRQKRTDKERDGRERRAKERDAPKDRESRKVHVDMKDKGKERQPTRDGANAAAKVPGNAPTPVPFVLPLPPVSAPLSQTHIRG
jgi:hypothetical protein